MYEKSYVFFSFNKLTQLRTFKKKVSVWIFLPEKSSQFPRVFHPPHLKPVPRSSTALLLSSFTQHYLEEVGVGMLGGMFPSSWFPPSVTTHLHHILTHFAVCSKLHLTSAVPAANAVLIVCSSTLNTSLCVNFTVPVCIFWGGTVFTYSSSWVAAFSACLTAAGLTFGVAGRSQLRIPNVCAAAQAKLKKSELSSIIPHLAVFCTAEDFCWCTSCFSPVWKTNLTSLFVFLFPLRSLSVTWATCMKTCGMDITWSRCWRSSLGSHWWASTMSPRHVQYAENRKIR